MWRHTNKRSEPLKSAREDEPNYTQIFSSLPLATPFLTSPEWSLSKRHRPDGPEGSDIDTFISRTIYALDGLQHHLELFKIPASRSDPVTEALSLFSFGPGLGGFPTILHGGAVASLVDESLAAAMVANETWLGRGPWMKEGRKWGAIPDPETGDDGGIVRLLSGYMVTAWLRIEFVAPVRCPGAVAFETKVLKDTGKRMNLKGVMKDGKGKVLVRAEGMWVRLGEEGRL